MSKINFLTVKAANALTAINANFASLAAELQNKVLYRNNPPGEPNALITDIDANGRDIYNVDRLSANEIALGGQVIDANDVILNNARFSSTVRTPNLAPINPISGALPGKFLAFDSNGQPITSSGTGADIGLRGDLAASTGASLVGFQQVGTGTGVRTLQDKDADTIAIQDFTVGTDSVRLGNALTAANGKVLRGHGATLTLTAPVTTTSENIVIEDLVLNIAGMGAGAGLTFLGTQGSSVALTANLSINSDLVTVGSTATFAAESYAWLQSTVLFENITNTPISQIVKIKQVVSATQLRLYEDVLYTFNTADASSIAPLALKQNITVRNVRVIGAQANIQSGIAFNKCANVVVEGANTHSVDYAGITATRCVNLSVSNSTFKDAQAGGLAYGVAILGGCYSAKVVNCYGEDMRHMVTVGDNTGINHFINVSNCHAAAMRDGGVDAHPATNFMVIDGNTVETTSNFSVARDGIIFQGTNVVISDNVVVGAFIRPIAVENYAQTGTPSVVITGNSIRDAGLTASTSHGIHVSNEAGAGGVLIRSLIVANNSISSAVHQGIWIEALSQSIRNVVVSGNIIQQDAVESGVYFKATAGLFIRDFSITGNIINAASAPQGIMLFGSTSPNILGGLITGNVIKDATFSVRYIQCQDISESNNFCTGFTNAHFIDTGSSDIDLSRRQSLIRTVTNSAGTLADQDNYIIGNRASTITLTLPNAALHLGREITVKTIQAQTIVSASANVVPITDTVAGTAICAAADGDWVKMVSDGTNWVVINAR